jgi:hypothetical protein
MNDFLIDMGFSTLFTLLRNLKGAKNKAKYQAAMLKLYRAIGTAYAGDPGFPD